MLHVILMEPETSGNIGAVARAMKNFGFSRLILIGPKADHLNDEAQKRAMRAIDVLKKAKVRDVRFLDEMDYVIGTTARLGTDYNLPRSVLSPEVLGEKISPYLKKRLKIGLLIGREASGLTNQEISKCDFTVSIPTHPTYPTLNISHAAAILLYELSKDRGQSPFSHLSPAGSKDKEIIMQNIELALDRLSFSTSSKKETQKTLWKRIVGKAMLTRREAFALMGFFKKIK